VTHLLAGERAAHVGPSDQHQAAAAAAPCGSSTVTVAGWQPSVALTGQPGRAAFAVSAAGQQQRVPQDQRALHTFTGQQLGPAAGAGRPPIGRPPSPLAHAHSAPRAASIPSGGSSGYSTPFRGTLSTVPSSVLLNVELEGNISEAALERLARIEADTSSRASYDAVDASHASMDGVGSHTGGHAARQPSQRQPQQQLPPPAAEAARVGRQGQEQGQQQQQQHHEQPPSEAECRLAYVSGRCCCARSRPRSRPQCP
jgi:hypothetical protein